MAKKQATDRSDPKQNKSLAIRNVLKSMPGAKASEVAAAVKKEHGHSVSNNMIYMIKTKKNMAKTRKKQKSQTNSHPMISASLWVDAIKTGRHLLQATGSVENAHALLKALNTQA